MAGLIQIPTIFTLPQFHSIRPEIIASLDFLSLDAAANETTFFFTPESITTSELLQFRLKMNKVLHTSAKTCYNQLQKYNSDNYPGTVSKINLEQLENGFENSINALRGWVFVNFSIQAWIDQMESTTDLLNVGAWGPAGNGMWNINQAFWDKYDDGTPYPIFDSDINKVLYVQFMAFEESESALWAGTKLFAQLVYDLKQACLLHSPALMSPLGAPWRKEVDWSLSPAPSLNATYSIVMMNQPPLAGNEHTISLKQMGWKTSQPKGIVQLPDGFIEFVKRLPQGALHSSYSIKNRISLMAMILSRELSVSAAISADAAGSPLSQTSTARRLHLEDPFSRILGMPTDQHMFESGNFSLVLGYANDATPGPFTIYTSKALTTPGSGDPNDPLLLDFDAMTDSPPYVATVFGHHLIHKHNKEYEFNIAPISSDKYLPFETRPVLLENPNKNFHPGYDMFFEPLLNPGLHEEFLDARQYVKWAESFHKSSTEAEEMIQKMLGLTWGEKGTKAGPGGLKSYGSSTSPTNVYRLFLRHASHFMATISEQSNWDEQVYQGYHHVSTKANQYPKPIVGISDVAPPSNQVIMDQLDVNSDSVGEEDFFVKIMYNFGFYDVKFSPKIPDYSPENLVGSIVMRLAFQFINDTIPSDAQDPNLMYKIFRYWRTVEEVRLFQQGLFIEEDPAHEVYDSAGNKVSAGAIKNKFKRRTGLFPSPRATSLGDDPNTGTDAWPTIIVVPSNFDDSMNEDHTVEFDGVHYLIGSGLANAQSLASQLLDSIADSIIAHIVFKQKAATTIPVNDDVFNYGQFSNQHGLQYDVPDFIVGEENPAYHKVSANYLLANTNLLEDTTMTWHWWGFGAWPTTQGHKISVHDMWTGIDPGLTWVEPLLGGTMVTEEAIEHYGIDVWDVYEHEYIYPAHHYVQGGFQAPTQKYLTSHWKYMNPRSLFDLNPSPPQPGVPSFFEGGTENFKTWLKKMIAGAFGQTGAIAPVWAKSAEDLDDGQLGLGEFMQRMVDDLFGSARAAVQIATGDPGISFVNQDHVGGIEMSWTGKPVVPGGDPFTATTTEIPYLTAYSGMDGDTLAMVVFQMWGDFLMNFASGSFAGWLSLTEPEFAWMSNLNVVFDDLTAAGVVYEGNVLFSAFDFLYTGGQMESEVQYAGTVGSEHPEGRGAIMTLRVNTEVNRQLSVYLNMLRTIYDRPGVAGMEDEEFLTWANLADSNVQDYLSNFLESHSYWTHLYPAKALKDMLPTDTPTQVGVFTYTPGTGTGFKTTDFSETVTDLVDADALNKIISKPSVGEITGLIQTVLANAEVFGWTTLDDTFQAMRKEDAFIKYATTILSKWSDGIRTKAMTFDMAMSDGLTLGDMEFPTVLGMPAESGLRGALSTAKEASHPNYFSYLKSRFAGISRSQLNLHLRRYTDFSYTWDRFQEGTGILMMPEHITDYADHHGMPGLDVNLRLLRSVLGQAKDAESFFSEEAQNLKIFIVGIRAGQLEALQRYQTKANSDITKSSSFRRSSSTMISIRVHRVDHTNTGLIFEPITFNFDMNLFLLEGDLAANVFLLGVPPGEEFITNIISSTKFSRARSDFSTTWWNQGAKLSPEIAHNNPGFFDSQFEQFTGAELITAGLPNEHVFSDKYAGEMYRMLGHLQIAQLLHNHVISQVLFIYYRALYGIHLSEDTYVNSYNDFTNHLNITDGARWFLENMAENHGTLKGTNLPIMALDPKSGPFVTVGVKGVGELVDDANAEGTLVFPPYLDASPGIPSEGLDIPQYSRLRRILLANEGVVDSSLTGTKFQNFKCLLQSGAFQSTNLLAGATARKMFERVFALPVDIDKFVIRGALQDVNILSDTLGLGIISPIPVGDPIYDIYPGEEGDIYTVDRTMGGSDQDFLFADQFWVDISLIEQPGTAMSYGDFGNIDWGDLDFL